MESRKRRRLEFKNSGQEKEEENDENENISGSEDEYQAKTFKRKRFERTDVLDFFNNSNLGEISCVKGISFQIANKIKNKRPYNNWIELTTILKEQQLYVDLLIQNCHDYIDRRYHLQNIISKCKEITTKLEKALEESAGIDKQPSLINPDLKLTDYQLVGLNWLVVLHRTKTNGILADEMGLGKTIQIIAFFAYLKETTTNKSLHLICVPSSTLDNWLNEFQKWCPSIKIEKYHGSKGERQKMRNSWTKNKFRKINVIVTTYKIMCSSEADRSFFRKTKFNYVVFDEAHMLKNMMTIRYSNLTNVNASKRILLTGTPLQNHLLELMSLLSFLMPNLFNAISNDMKELFPVKSQKNLESELSVFEQTQIQTAKEIMKPFVMRRLKKNVLNLPIKTEIVQKIELLPEQKEKYKELKDELENLDLNQKYRFTSAILMDMRKLANHPLLLRQYFTDDHLEKVAEILAKDPHCKSSKSEDIFEDIAPLSDFKIHQLSKKYPSIKQLVKIPNELILNSAKFRFLDHILPKFKAEGRRVLMFSQFVMMLDIVEKYLEIRKLKYLRLDGSTHIDMRQGLIEEFNVNSKIFIFIISTKAGGLGINLTSADRVIIFDIDVNPYNDKQAEDRCHRIGQNKEVIIYKLIAEGTVEENMYEIAERKLLLEREVTSNKIYVDEEKKNIKNMEELAIEVFKNQKANFKL